MAKSNAKRFVEARFINVTAVHDDASTTSRQVYSEDVADAFDAAFEIVERGIFDVGTWDKRVLFVFMHDTNTGTTFVLRPKRGGLTGLQLVDAGDVVVASKADSKAGIVIGR